MRLVVQSIPVSWKKYRDRLQFFGRTTVLQIHETGFTVEGFVPDVWFPLIMRFIYRTVSEWTMRSIPFSRIQNCEVVSRAFIRFMIAFPLFVFFSVVGLWLWSSQPLLSVVLFICGTGVSYLVLKRALNDYVLIEFVQANGRPCAIRFRFKKSGHSLLLFEEISRHRLQSSAPALARLADKVTSKKPRLIDRLWQRGAKS
jgi:hypothetical protein